MRRSGRAGLIRRRLRHAYAPTRRCATGPSKRGSCRSGCRASRTRASSSRACRSRCSAGGRRRPRRLHRFVNILLMLHMAPRPGAHERRRPSRDGGGVLRPPGRGAARGRRRDAAWGSNGLIGVTPRPLIDGTTGRLRYVRSADFGHKPHRRLGTIPPPRQLACGHRNLAQTCSQTDAVVAPGAKTPPHAAHHSAAIPIAAVMCAPRGA